MEYGGAQARPVSGNVQRALARALPIIAGVDDTRADVAGPAPLQEGAVTHDADAALMLAYAAGDATAFNALYERHERPVFRFLRRSLGADGESVVDELHQEVWLAVVRNATNYEPRARFTTWLYGIARSKLIDHWRARRPGVSLDEPAANDADESLLDQLPAEPGVQPEAQALTRAQGAAFLRAVEQLPAVQREVFLLHAEGELTLAEIGTLTGVGMETAKSRLRYALEKLRATLAAWR